MVGVVAMDRPDAALFTGAHVPSFKWPKTGEWFEWEAYLYALVWLRLTVVEQGVPPDGTNYEELWEAGDGGFPRVPAKSQAWKLGAVVQVMRHPKQLVPSWDSSMPKFPANAKMYFEARPLADYLHRISKYNTGGPTAKIGPNSRLNDSRLRVDGWWRLVSDPYCRARLLQLLEIYHTVSEGESR